MKGPRKKKQLKGEGIAMKGKGECISLREGVACHIREGGKGCEDGKGRPEGRVKGRRERRQIKGRYYTVKKGRGGRTAREENKKGVKKAGGE